MGLTSRFRTYSNSQTILEPRDLLRATIRVNTLFFILFLSVVTFEWAQWIVALGFWNVGTHPIFPILMGITLFAPLRYFGYKWATARFPGSFWGMVVFIVLDLGVWILLGLVQSSNPLRYVMLYLLAFPYVAITLFMLNPGLTLLTLCLEVVGFFIILSRAVTVGWLPKSPLWILFYWILGAMIGINGGIIVYLARSFKFRYRRSRGYQTMLRGQRDELMNRQQLIKSFYARVSHELRTPLHGIMGMTTLLQDGGLSSELFDYTLAIRSNAESLLSIINDILDKSKLDAGYFVAEQRQFSLSDTIDMVVLTIRHAIGNRPIRLEVGIDSMVPDSLLGDQTRLIQVLFNILGNAAKFTQEGSIQLDVNSENGKNNFCRLFFTITDTGIGIPKQFLPNIFDEYVQVNPGQGHPGTGLGLSITHDIIQALRGSIEVESHFGKGTSFRVVLPFQYFVPEQGNAKTIQPSLFSEGEGSESVSGFRVLVVDDNTINRHIMERMLEKGGCIVHQADSGLGALSYLTSSEYDLVLLDYEMPDVNGIEVIKRLEILILEAGGAWGGTTLKNIVLITGHGTEIITNDVLEKIHSFLQKPIRLSQILNLLNNHI